MWLFDWRRLLVYTHRWLGIAGCLVFIVWFVSGIVMMYARMPVLTTEERLARLPVLDLSAARLPPDEAARIAGVSPDRLRVGMYDGRAVYRLLSNGRWTTVAADSGTPLEPVTAGAAIAIARRWRPEHQSTLRYDAYLEDADQWTFSVRALMPMHRIDLGDAASTYLYISDQTAEPVMTSTRAQRVWAFFGAVLHWIYFAPLRRQSSLWSEVIIWSSIAGCLMCLTGLAWGLWRFSPRAAYRMKGETAHSPYAGFMLWHHYAGLFFGLVSFTWILSGLLSMTPWDWSPGTAPSRQQRDAVQGGPLRLDTLSLDRLRAAVSTIGESFPVKELEVGQLAGETFVMAYQPPALDAHDRWTSPYFHVAPPPAHRLVSMSPARSGAFTRFDDAAMMAAGMAAMPGVAVESADWLHAYDAYYYDRHGARPLPILRIRFDDPERTWLYLDPRTGVITQKLQRLSRLNRWLYHGFHSLDFPGLYASRPLWDIVVIALSIGGIVLSVTTLAPAWRRLRRHVRRMSRRDWNDAEKRIVIDGPLR